VNLHQETVHLLVKPTVYIYDKIINGIGNKQNGCAVMIYGRRKT
jgi:hypothetical protein